MTDRDKFLEFCQKQLNKPYVLGSVGPDTFDCSGLIYAALSTLFQVKIPRISTDQFALGLDITPQEVRVGDIIFFDSGWTDRVPNHNGICSGNGKMINANSYQANVCEEAFTSGYWSGKISGVRRIFDKAGNLDLYGKNSAAAKFPDVLKSHPDFVEIEQLRQNGVVRGFSDGTFRPDQLVTRAETIKILLLCFEVPLVDIDPSLFSDVTAADWHIVYITTAKKRNIISGYPDGTFKPGAKVNRAELVKLIFQTAGVKAGAPTSADFSDVSSAAWFYQYAYEAKKRAMFRFSANKFLPAKAVTRGELCRAIVHFLEYKNG